MTVYRVEGFHRGIDAVIEARSEYDAKRLIKEQIDKSVNEVTSTSLWNLNVDTWDVIRVFRGVKFINKDEVFA